MAPHLTSATFLLVMMIGIRVTSAELCTSHGSGCRAPFGLDVAYESLFRPSCHRHSICYSCGASAGLTKADCDKALRANMYAACAPLADPDVCRFQADNVFSLQTHVMGTNYFHPARLPAPWCVEHGVDQCLPLGGASASSSTTAAGLIGR